MAPSGVRYLGQYGAVCQQRKFCGKLETPRQACTPACGDFKHLELIGSLTIRLRMCGGGDLGECGTVRQWGSPNWGLTLPLFSARP